MGAHFESVYARRGCREAKCGDNLCHRVDDDPTTSSRLVEAGASARPRCSSSLVRDIRCLIDGVPYLVQIRVVVGDAKHNLCLLGNHGPHGWQPVLVRGSYGLGLDIRCSLTEPSRRHFGFRDEKVVPRSHGPSVSTSPITGPS